MRTNLTADTYRRFFSTKDCFVEKNVTFGMSSGSKGDYIDIWMIKVKVPMKRNFLFFHIKERKK